MKELGLLLGAFTALVAYQTYQEARKGRQAIDHYIQMVAL